jgi:AraC-like DNA-binding protein
LFLDGGVNYFIEKNVYPLSRGDLLLINNHEIHRPSLYDHSVYERIVIHFDPSIVSDFSTREFDILSCFKDHDAGENNRITLDSYSFEKILSLLQEIGQNYNMKEAESALLVISSFIRLLVMINKLYKEPSVFRTNPKLPDILIPILEHIDRFPDEDLSLSNLEYKFHINRYHLARLFKKHTGSKLHQYIIYKRISRAKQLLIDGHNVTETSVMSGFNDYSNFYRMFKKAVGITPGEFKKLNTKTR